MTDVVPQGYVVLENSSLFIHKAEKIGNIIILYCKANVLSDENYRYKIACTVEGTTG
jgi:hypothetical protein